MAKRFQVARLWVKHRGTVYKAGELLPENFTDRDRARNIYSRRIVQVEIPDDPSPILTPEGTIILEPSINALKEEEKAEEKVKEKTEDKTEEKTEKTAEEKIKEPPLSATTAKEVPKITRQVSPHPGAPRFVSKESRTK